MQRTKTWRPDGPALAATALGFMLFLVLYGPSTLNPTYDSWIFNGYIGVDILQHYAGWAAFRAGAWQWPLTFTSLLSWPFGGAASLADCIPLFAVPFKLLGPLLPDTFQYFGLFTAFCMAMAGYAGAKLLGLFAQNPTFQVLGSVFFVAGPVLLERAFQHSALAAQFLVVLGLYLYFKARRSGFTRPMWAFIPLAAAATATHVYFVPMVLGLCFAAAVDGAHTTQKALPFAGLAAAVAACLATAFSLGFFSYAEYVPGGYGNFGVNLNAFWNPTSYNWATWDDSYQNLVWSRLLPQRPVVGDSLGSFAYLGLGILLGFCVLAGLSAVWLWRHRQKGRHLWQKGLAFLNTHTGLLAAIFLLSAFAVSNVVTANSRTLFTLPLPQAILRLCDVFRSSGRLIWPLYHLLVLCALVGVARLGTALWRHTGDGAGFRRVWPAAFCGVLLLVQGWDMGPVLAQKHAYFAVPVVPQSYAAPDNWENIACPGRVFYVLEPTEDRTTALRAALCGMPSNFYLLARGSQTALAEDRAATLVALQSGNIPHKNAVYATKDETLAAGLTAALAERCEVLNCAGYTMFLPQA